MKNATNPNQPKYKPVGFSSAMVLDKPCSCPHIDVEQLRFQNWLESSHLKSINCRPFYECCRAMDAWIPREFALRTFRLSKFDSPKHPPGIQSYTVKRYSVVIHLDTFYMSSEEVLCTHLKTRFLRRDIDFEELAKDLFERLMDAEGSRIADIGWPTEPTGSYIELIDASYEKMNAVK